jgi:predicted PurR-regulated permease PerM
VPGFLRPSVDLVARLKTTVHLKLLAGFLVIALLLLLMGILSIVVIARMNQQVDQLVALQAQTDLARQAIYSVTAQSHYRAMALITWGMGSSPSSVTPSHSRTTPSGRSPPPSRCSEASIGSGTCGWSNTRRT